MHMLSKILLSVLAASAAAPMAFAAVSDSGAASQVSDWFAAKSGWQTERIFYANTAAGLPAGRWDYQYQNAFAGVPTPPGAGWNTWNFTNKPPAAAWTGTFYSAPYPHVDTSAFGSTAENWGYVSLYTGFAITGGGYYAKKGSYSRANAVANADSPTVAQTRVTDPWTIQAQGSGAWTVAMEYSELGSFSSPQAQGALFAEYGISLNPSAGSSTAYNLLSVNLSADGSNVAVSTALNGNNAEISGSLMAGQLNGVLLLNGVAVTAAQATAALQARYSSGSGWSLNPNGYTLEGFHPDDPTEASSVFSLSARVFLDALTSSVTMSTANGSTAVAAVPEAGALAMLLAGLGCIGTLTSYRRTA